MGARQLTERWLYATLSELPHEVSRDRGPADVVHPSITFAMISSRVTNVVGRGRSKFEALTYIVNVYDEGESSADVNSIAEQIEDMLDGAGPINVEGGVILACRRIGYVPITSEVVDGTSYQRNASEYIIEVLVD